MKYIADHDYHIHSCLSPCSGDEKQTAERILSDAEACGLTSVCLTDHFWDSSVAAKVGKPDFYDILDYEYVSKWLPLPQKDNVKFYFGCECELLCDMTLGISAEVAKKMDFIVIPPNHFHMQPYTLAECDRPIGKRARAYLNRLRGILDMELPFDKIGIAHFTDSLTAAEGEHDHIDVISMMPTDELTDIFGRMAHLGIGIELNFDPDGYSGADLEEILRPYKIASECGCKFYLGSDAHTVGDSGVRLGKFEKAIELLSLEEDQKYHIPEKRVD